MRSIAILLVLSAPCYAQLGSSTNIFRFKKFDDNAVQRSLVRIHSIRSDGVGLGSGVLIGKDHILTAYHVVSGATSFDVLVPHKAYTFKDAKLLYFDPELDLAVLKAPLPQSIKPLTISKSVPKQGDSVQFLGFAGGSLPRHFDCVVLDVDNKGQKLLINSAVIQGDSGGVILNKDNEVVGCIQIGMISISSLKSLERGKVYSPLLLALTTGHDCRAIAKFLEDNK